MYKKVKYIPRQELTDKEVLALDRKETTMEKIIEAREKAKLDWEKEMKWEDERWEWIEEHGEDV